MLNCRAEIYLHSIHATRRTWIGGVLLLLLVQDAHAISFKAAASAAARTATVSYRAVGNVVNAASGNVTAPLPAAAFGEIYLCQVESRDNVAHSMPAGWAQVYSLSSSATHRASLFYKVSAATETNPLITHLGGSNIIARCTRFRGVDPGDPFDVPHAAQYAASSATVSTGSLTTVTANDMLLFTAHLASNPGTLSTPSGWTRPYYSTTTGAGIALHYKTQATPALVGPFTATASATAENHGVLLALQPASTLSISKPTGTVAGDVMVAAIATVPSTIPITAPSGWTLIQSQQQTSTNSSVLASFYRVAGSSEPATYTWILSNVHSGAVGGILTYSGVDTATPIDVSAKAATSSSTSHAAPTVTTTQAGDMLVTVHEFASARSWTPPSGMTERVDIASRAPNNSGVTLEMNDLLLGAAGSTGPKTATASSSADAGATMTIALRASASAPHHLEILHDGAGITCAPETVTVRACADASCTTLYTVGGVTGTLSPNGSAFIIGVSGSTTGTVNPTTAGTYTLNATGLTPAPSGVPAVSCLNTATGVASCSMVFTASGLTLTLPNFPAATGTSVATIKATNSSCDPLFSGNRSIRFFTAYTNPSTGTLQATVNGTTISTVSGSPTTLTLNFNSSGISTFTLNYPDAGRVTLDATDGVTGTRGSCQFVAYPTDFTLSAIKRSSDNFANPGAANAAGTAFVKAGDNFSVTVSARNSLSNVTPNFGREMPAEGVTLTPTLIADPDLSNNPSLGGTFGAFSGGSASGAAFTWGEVGIITFVPSLTSGNFLSTGVNVIGASSGNIGRFYPHHFGMTPDASEPIVNRAEVVCAGCAFTYMGERMDARFTLIARALNGDTTLNYTGAYAKFNPAASGNPLSLGAVDSALPTYLTARLNTSLNASGSFTNGEADIVAPLAITRGTAPDGPYAALKIGIAPMDTDGLAMGAFDLNADAVAGNEHALVGGTAVRYGRMKLSNAHGSELLQLPMPIAVQYWNGTSFIINADDNDTVLLSANIVLSNYKLNLNSGETTLTVPVISNGAGQILLSKPGVGNSGSVDIATNAPSYLPSNTARATFGIYKGGPLIYQRENY